MWSLQMASWNADNNALPARLTGRAEDDVESLAGSMMISTASQHTS